MIVTLSIPDDVYKQYVEQSKTNPQRVMEGLLKQFAAVAPSDRTLLLTKAQQKRLEALFQLPIEDFDKAIDRIEHLHQIKAGDALITLTPYQQKRLEGEAVFYKKPYPEYVGERIGTILKQELGS